MSLYTKNGRPLQVSGDKVFSRSSRIVGRIKGDRVYGTDGGYVGTIVNDRLVYRSSHSARVSSPFSASNRAVTARANRAGSGVWGDEPVASLLPAQSDDSPNRRVEQVTGLPFAFELAVA
jgi:hypothetical protein